MNARDRTGPRLSRLAAGSALVLAASVAACASPATIPASVVPSVAPTDATPSVAPTDATPSELATAPPASQEWVAVAPLRTDRTGFDAAVLGDGSVLVVGDDRDCEPGGAIAGSERAERYDGSADAWSDVDSLNKPRKSFATVTLADGSAMVLGGVNSDDVPFSSTKVFSAATGTWDSGPLMTVARAAPFAVTLRNGRVLVVSVLDPVRSIATSEVYDPSTGSWGQEAALPKRVLWLHALVALGDG
ncbi:MAG TPA: kelch repeat-containing protein, partial [Clostridia bacterium]|nr:kelch repeat-containing protein [Clostridia bacterium]